MNLIIIIFILIINIINVNVVGGKVILHNNDTVLSKEQSRNKDKLVKTDTLNKFKIFNHGKNIVIKTDTAYINLPYGDRCDAGENRCSLEFKELGPFTYNDFTECYIHMPTSGPDDKYKKKTRFFERIYMDINATLKCVVNGITYTNVQRVNIHGYDNKLPSLNSFKPGTRLSHGTTSIGNGRDFYYVTLSDCTYTWTHRTNYDLDCHVDKIRMVTEGRCGRVNGEYLICQNQCCGQDGFCSNQPNSCGVGCQKNFGICNP
ncbi:hypothetical protein PIROE2DRAFT_61551 [Piromyces sp. E2]|nr:hypothetical protein PIROE2DRAFT_61551 [Piromyces sp. E2]|eukprot:OUM62969.1 hypothetical protein PIROE2DRAFT_61551 [Piromyces sp. E2]